MEDHDTPARPSPPPRGEDRFDALLEERFSRTGRREMAHEIASHDRERTPEGFDLAHVRRKMRFRGNVPEKVQTALREWVPALLAHAAAQGLRLSDLNHELHFFDRAAFEAEAGPIPAGVTLPASSFQYNQLYRVYTVRVVLPGEIDSVTQLLTVLRAALTRFLGDIYLRTEIFTLEAYREDVEEAEEDISVGMEEKIRVLAGGGMQVPELEAALLAHGKAVGLSYKRAPDQVRKAFFREAEANLEKQRLSPEREAVIDHAFGRYLRHWQADPARAVTEMIGDAEALNGQINFLPPDEQPEYLRLKEANPPHYLRSAHLRLGFLLEVLGGFGDLFESLSDPDASLSPLVEEHVEGYMAHLRTEKLVRPYLIPDAQLSDELERLKAAFPFEVHSLLARMPEVKDADRAFKSLSNKLTNSIYQRVYTALLIVTGWAKARDQGREDAFRGSERFKSLRGLVANFKFRMPLLEALYIKIGVVLELVERAARREAASSTQFPVEGFARAWGQFIPHVLIAGYFGGRSVVKGFDPEKYRESVEDALRSNVAHGSGPGHLAWCLKEIHAQAGDEGLAVLSELLRNPSGTFRFTVNRALADPPPATADDPAARLEQLGKWAEAVVQARAATLRNAIVPGAE